MLNQVSHPVGIDLTPLQCRCTVSTAELHRQPTFIILFFKNKTLELFCTVIPIPSLPMSLILATCSDSIWLTWACTSPIYSVLGYENWFFATTPTMISSCCVICTLLPRSVYSFIYAWEMHYPVAWMMSAEIN